MPLPSFSNGEVLTAAKLNAMIAKLNQIEPLTSVPVPLFQARRLDGEDYAGIDSNNRTWRYLIFHKQYNTHLHYSYFLNDPDTDTDVKIYVADNPTPYDLPTPHGHTAGSINISGLGIGVGEFYVVRFKVVRDAASYVSLDFLYEKAGA